MVNFFSNRKMEKQRKIQNLKNEKIICDAKALLKNENFSIISANCVGGVFYHDMNMRFLSPTVNLFFYPEDFIKYVNNLQAYNELTPDISFDEKLGYPVGKLNDIKIYFMHYKSCEEALCKWEERK